MEGQLLASDKVAHLPWGPRAAERPAAPRLKAGRGAPAAACHASKLAGAAAGRGLLRRAPAAADVDRVPAAQQQLAGGVVAAEADLGACVWGGGWVKGGMAVCCVLVRMCGTG